MSVETLEFFVVIDGRNAASDPHLCSCNRARAATVLHEPAAPIARDDPRVFWTLATDVIATDGLPPTAVFQINQALVVISARASDDYSGAIAFFAVRLVTDKRHISLSGTFIINGTRRTYGIDPAVRAACEWVAMLDDLRHWMLLKGFPGPAALIVDSLTKRQSDWP